MHAVEHLGLLADTFRQGRFLPLELDTRTSLLDLLRQGIPTIITDVGTFATGGVDIYMFDERAA